MISVIIPVFNNENTIEKCINSYLNQSYKNIEIIIIDDGSKKENAKLYDQISSIHDNVQVYHYKNEGVSAARNHGVGVAKGEYIFFADSDDYADSNMFAEFIQMKEKYNNELIIAGYYFDIVTKSGSIKYVKQSVDSRLICGKENVKCSLVNLWDSSMMYNTWNKLFETNIIKKNNICFQKGKFFNEDREFVREYVNYIDKIYVTDKAFYHYVRERGESVTSKYRYEMLEIRKEELKRLIDYFTKNGIYDSIAKEYVAREHFDRIVGTIESIFHEKNMNKSEKIKEIKRIINDQKTIWCMENCTPKSIKMKVIFDMYKTKNIYVIYIMMYLIYQIEENHTDLFYRLRQTR